MVVSQFENAIECRRDPINLLPMTPQLRSVVHPHRRSRCASFQRLLEYFVHPWQRRGQDACTRRRWFGRNCRSNDPACPGPGWKPVFSLGQDLGVAYQFDQARFDAGVKSTQWPEAPAGLAG